MRTTMVVATLVGALPGLWIGHDTAGIGGALVWAVLWGFGGLLVGRAIVSTGHLLWRLGSVGIAIILFILAVALTWGVRF